ncbi:hypothetical protein AAV97_18245 [Acinetobacter sp. Ag2]|uniref:hypothetical protein n=1 Tax=Acinetobacter sp. Ag2 TaxID=1646532 RepID=UPI000629C8D8|nr:hypothetical protein [Acinetobacter sp. Ag2]KKW75727.1 hypothetical protein AAV97_18245 [Acinetobacter sp. Ag2]
MDSAVKNEIGFLLKKIEDQIEEVYSLKGHKFGVVWQEESNDVQQVFSKLITLIRVDFESNLLNVDINLLENKLTNFNDLLKYYYDELIKSISDIKSSEIFKKNILEFFYLIAEDLINNIKNKIFSKIPSVHNAENLFLFIKDNVGVIDIQIDGGVFRIKQIKNIFLSLENHLNNNKWLFIPEELLKDFIEKSEALIKDHATLNLEYVRILETINSYINRNYSAELFNFVFKKDYFKIYTEYETVREEAHLKRLWAEKLKLLDEFKKSEDEVIADHTKSFNGFKKLLTEIQGDSNKSKKYLESIKEDNDIIFSYLESVRNTDSIKVYSDLYNKELFSAEIFRFFSLFIYGILSFIALVCLVALFLFDSNNIVVQNLTDLKKTYAKIPFLIVFFGFAFYLSREGEKHRRIANQAKQTEAELIALTSYTNGWDQNDIKELKIKLADKYFGKTLYDLEKATSSDVDVLSALVQQTKVSTDLAKLILDNDKAKNDEASK